MLEFASLTPTYVDYVDSNLRGLQFSWDDRSRPVQVGPDSLLFSLILQALMLNLMALTPFPPFPLGEGPGV
jgi:hypothetical protein